MTPEQERLFIAELEKLGETRVRDNLNHDKISAGFVHLASTWLSEKERKSECRKEASTSEQIEIARRASDAAVLASDAADRAATATERQATAAERANTRATIALIIAIISITVSAIGIWMPYWSAHK